MWKTFKYSNTQRVAYLPSSGPAYQVINDGQAAPGFRNFAPEKMQDMASAENLFPMVREEDLEDHPLLELAKWQA